MLSGRASELERELPFGAWGDALADYAGALGMDRLERIVGDQLPELAAVLPSVGTPSGLQDERYRTHRALQALLEGLAKIRPVVLTLDDLHWADDSSLEAVAHLLRHPPKAPLLLALAFRPAPVRPLLSGALHTAERDGTLTERPLVALSREEAEALLGEGVPGPVRGAIFDEAAATRSSSSSSRASTRPAAAWPPPSTAPPRRASRARSCARSTRRSPRSPSPGGCLPRAPRWPATRSTSTSPPRPRSWTSERRWTRSTSCWPAGCC